MWKDSVRNIVVIFQTNILRIVGFYVRHSASVYTVHRALHGRFYDFCCNKNRWRHSTCFLHHEKEIGIFSEQRTVVNFFLIGILAF